MHMDDLLGGGGTPASTGAAKTTTSTKTKEKRPRGGSNSERVAAPKAFKNAYLHFALARRGEVAALAPDWTVQQVSAEVGRQWKTLTPQDRKPWVELAQFDKARFHSELEQYLEKRRAEEVRLSLSYSIALTLVSSV